MRAPTSGSGVNAVVDLAGGTLFPRTFEWLASQGWLVLVGLAAGRTAELDLGVVLTRPLRIEGTARRSRAPRQARAGAL
ncbi:MAG TPA: hypothetical protein VNL18_07445 [Gemmatimonadales bacterium]|nr:hypothetical protein [Gemmatimonadales bacterium]